MSKSRNRSSGHKHTASPIAIFSVLFFIWAHVGCGVKADPTPPDRSPVIGRGQPTYREAVKNLKPLEKVLQDEDEGGEN